MIRGFTTLCGLVWGASVALAEPAADRFASLAAAPEGPLRKHGEVGYVAPPGWAVSSDQGVTVLNAPTPPSVRPCAIMLLPPMPAQPDLAMEAEQIVNALFARQTGPVTDADFGGDFKATRYEGISGTGWSYVDLWGKLGKSPVYVHVLLAQMGSQVLPVLGLTTTVDCMGHGFSRDHDIWALMFHGLRLPGYTEDSPKLGSQIIGTWTGASGGAGNSMTFAPNGRFGSIGMYHGYRVSGNEVYEVTKSWPGDGPYEVHGDRLHTENPNGAESQRNLTRLFSIVRHPKKDQPGQFDTILRTVEHSDNGRIAGNSPSGNYVFGLTKQQ